MERTLRLSLCLLLGMLLLTVKSAEAQEWYPVSPLEWQIQLKGEIDTSQTVDLFVVDLFEASADAITTIHANGSRVVCYFRAGVWEEWRSDAGGYPSTTKGNTLSLFGGLWWQDIRSERVESVMRGRLAAADAKGCDGVLVDNVDSYRHDTGFPIAFEDQLSFNRMLISEAHRLDLAIGMTLDSGQMETLVDELDFVVIEQCFSKEECPEVEVFLDQAKPVLALILSEEADAKQTCVAALESGFDPLVKAADLGPERLSCRDQG